MKIYSSRLTWILGILLLVLSLSLSLAYAENPVRFKHIPLQYIVALGDPEANSGSGAESWGLWNQDPGPRGCRLENYKQLKDTGVAPAKWRFDKRDWWLEEHGLMMEKPTFPLAPGKYVVTGGRSVTSVLIIDPADKNGAQNWHLENGAKLHDVTHLPCHAARYIPSKSNATCSPDAVNQKVFPVAPGVAMPAVTGCAKKDYAVLFVIGIADKKE